jgi:GNAT superfamily N-acetyltransferase
MAYDSPMTAASPPLFREAHAEDVPAIFDVRNSVTENLVSIERLAQFGITIPSMIESFTTHSKGWVAERNGNVVAFSIANRKTRSIFALFVRPGYDQQGLGSHLLDLAVDWLWDTGATTIWLTTAPNTRADRFYRLRGWTDAGIEPSGEVRFEKHLDDHAHP